jgi:hypothetical protein
METLTTGYLQRTEWNVRDTIAVKHNKPCLHAHSGQEDVAQSLRDFVADNEILTLNVAGPRES